MTDTHDPEGAAYRWALRTGVIAVAVVATVGMVIAGVTRGGPGLWGAGAGALLGAVSGVVTPAVMMTAYRKKPEVFAGIVAGTWLAKMVVIVAGMAVVSRIDSLDRQSFAGVVLACIVCTLTVDVMAVRRARIPYVHGGSGGPTS